MKFTYKKSSGPILSLWRKWGQKYPRKKAAPFLAFCAIQCSIQSVGQLELSRRRDHEAYFACQ